MLLSGFKLYDVLKRKRCITPELLPLAKTSRRVLSPQQSNKQRQYLNNKDWEGILDKKCHLSMQCVICVSPGKMKG